jgi:hypothetical protein
MRLGRLSGGRKGGGGQRGHLDHGIGRAGGLAECWRLYTGTMDAGGKPMHETGDPGRETLNAGTDPSLPVSFEAPYSEMPSNKSFRTKVVLAKAAKQNRCVSPHRLQSPRSPLSFSLTLASSTARSPSGSASSRTRRSSTTVRDHTFAEWRERQNGGKSPHHRKSLRNSFSDRH